jgi:DNA-binding NtrC family response regulator
MKTLVRSRNPALREIDRTLARLAATPLSLLIGGETGTGKSYVARRIHAASRAGRPLVVVDCGGLPATLVAGELFGHRSGAFTDATRARDGWLARAGEGTLVLDRVDVMPAEGQVALLRVLEERHFVPVGGGVRHHFRARVIALTSTPAAESSGGGGIRGDLYHRLAGLHVVLPPLRARAEDIVPLARARLGRLGRRMGRRMTLDREAELLLAAYSWPGNVRELHTVLERAALTAERDTVGAAELALPCEAWEDVLPLAGRRRASLAEVTRLYALWTLAAERGNVTRAARALGISRRTLIRWRKGS